MDSLNQAHMLDLDTIKNKAGETSTIENQIEGVLHMRIGRQRKVKHCLVKDGFFLWYKLGHSDVVERCGFDTKPQGLLPLAGAVVEMVQHPAEEDVGSFTIHHSDIPHVMLELKAEDGFAAHHWVKALESAQKANYVNGKLGYELMEQYASKDIEKQEEHKNAVEELKKRAQEKRRDEKEKMRVSRMLKNEGKLERELEALEQEANKEKQILKDLKSLAKTEMNGPNLKRKNLAQENIRIVESSVEQISKTLLIATDLKWSGKNPEKAEAKRKEIRAAISTLEEFLKEAKSHSSRGQLSPKRPSFVEMSI